MIEFYEFVSLYHPDRLCDYLVSCLLDYCIKKDKYVKYRVECILNNNTLFFFGTIRTPDLHNLEALKFLKSKVEKLNLKYEVIETIEITNESNTSRDFNGTGIYFGYASKGKEHIPTFYNQTKRVSNQLEYLFEADYYKSSFTKENNIINCNVILRYSNSLKVYENYLYEYLDYIFKDESYRLNLDLKSSKNLLGMTGRKLCFDYYNGLVPNNGGSFWGKDPFNEDVTLNYYARQLALQERNNLNLEECVIKLYYLGKNGSKYEVYCKDNNLPILTKKVYFKQDFVEKLGLLSPIYSKLCKSGIFFRKI